jgi:predicted DNA-binding transcriptional regulator YafY
VIGAQWVSRQTDDSLAFAVKNALAKINAVLPPDMRSALNEDMIYVGHPRKSAGPLDLSEIRRSLREQRKLRITLSLKHLNLGKEIIWPIMLGFIESKRFIAAWCELDEKFRVIGLEDIETAEVLVERYSRNRRQLVKEWRAQELRPCNSEGEVC